MAPGPLVPSSQFVYRGLRNANWSKNGIVQYRAFMLRPATEKFPIEQEISLGTSPETAVEELSENFGVASLQVASVHGLPRELRVHFEQGNPAKAEMIGLPLFSTDQTLRALAITIATELAGISTLI